jgi:hypothetical protein
MAACATIDYAKFGKPDLLYPTLKMTLQRIGLAAVANQAQITVLIVTPLAEKVLRRSDRDRHQEHDANDTERSYAVSEEFLPERRKFFFHDRRILILWKGAASAAPLDA